MAGVWKDESVVARGLKVFLTLVAVVFPIACSPQPQTHPLDTAPIPANARILEEPCSPLGAMMCGTVSILSGETAVERRSACIIYVEPSGRRVEQCGSLPASHPYLIQKLLGHASIIMTEFTRELRFRKVRTAHSATQGKTLAAGSNLVFRFCRGDLIVKVRQGHFFGI